MFQQHQQPGKKAEEENSCCPWFNWAAQTFPDYTFTCCLCNSSLVTIKTVNFYLSPHILFIFFLSFSKFPPFHSVKTFRIPSLFSPFSQAPTNMYQDILQLSQNDILIISLVTKAVVRSRWPVAAQEVHHGHLSAPTQASHEPWVLLKAGSIHNCHSLQRMC